MPFAITSWHALPSHIRRRCGDPSLVEVNAGPSERQLYEDRSTHERTAREVLINHTFGPYRCDLPGVVNNLLVEATSFGNYQCLKPELRIVDYGFASRRRPEFLVLGSTVISVQSVARVMQIFRKVDAHLART
jgi:hypothetical protein